MSRSAAHRVAALMAAVAFVAACGGSAHAGWLAGHPCRQEVLIDPAMTASNLTDYPLLVQITSPGNPLFGSAGSGQDIVFTAADGTTVLPREIEHYSAANQELDAWVKTNVSATTPTKLYMYYGGANAANSTTTWDAAYKMVQHLQENPAGAVPQMEDSTENGNHGRTYGTMTSADQVPGQVDGSLRLDGADDWVRCGNDNSLNTTGDYTIEMWAYNAAGAKSYPTLLNRAPQAWPNGENGYFWIYTTGTNESTLNFQYADGSAPRTQAFASALDKDKWNHIVFTFQDSEKKLDLYVDGQPTGGERTLTNSLPVDDGTLYLGTYNNSSARYPFGGQLDEVRLSTVARSAEWVEASYNNMSDADAYVKAACAEGAVGWLAGRAYRQAVTIPKGVVPKNSQGADVVLDQFPVLVKISGDDHPELFEHASSPDGLDIVFTGAHGVQILPREIERYVNTPTTKELWAWVNTPISSADDTTLYMYYGSPEVPNSTDTWDPHYKMVHHLEGNPAGTVPQMLDSTGHANHGSCSGMTAANQATGQVDGALSFDGVNDFVNCGSKTSLNTPADYTIEMWVYNDVGAKKYPTLFNRGGQSGVDGFLWSYIRTDEDPTTLYFQYAHGSGYGAPGFANALPENEWSHIAFTFEDATKELRLFRNGVQLGITRTLTNALPVDDGIFYLGTYLDLTSNYPFGGIFDEARLSDIERSPEWLLASYRLMAEDHLTFGEPQIPEPATLVLLGLGLLLRRRRR